MVKGIEWTTVTREERLQEIGRRLYEKKVNERVYSEEVKELRDEFFRLHDDGVKGQSYRLPVKTIEVPDEFFETTQMSKEDFVATRFPNWEVEHIEKNTALNKTVFVLKQNYHYVPGVVDIEDGDKILRVSKEVSEYTPEMDWDTLKQERPDLFERLAQPVTSYEIDEENFAKLIDESPEELATIQRHMRVKPPTLRATARRIKKDE